MPDEEIDKLVRDAASQHHPPYDDTAWGKMEVLLDKHLPQKKDRRKPVIFLLLFLVVGGAAFWGIKSATHNNDTVATTANTASAAATPGENKLAVLPGTPVTAAPTTVDNGNTTTGNTLASSQQPGNTTAGNGSIPGDNNGGAKNGSNFTNIPQSTGAANDNEAYAIRRKITGNKKSRTSIKVKQPGTAAADDNIASIKTSVDKNDVTDNTTNIAVDIPATKEGNNEKDAVKPEVAISKTDVAGDKKEVKPEVEKTATDKNTAATSAKQKTSKSFADKFAVTVSAGADLSFIELSKLGKTKPAVGAGLSYAISKHITVASGLYVTKKVYTATPYQYKVTGYVNPSLKEVGADCKVFEIPVSVYYSFKQVKNHNWLAGLSLSSLLMKRETYDYFYETPGGQTYSYDKTLTNENNHYFSVLTLSGGYQYKLNNRFSFIAEPYVKVPLTGIGLGKIKLNSTGILVTAAIKPFAKKRK